MPQYTCPACGLPVQVEGHWVGVEMKCSCGKRFLPVRADHPPPAAPHAGRWVFYILLLVLVGMLIAALVWLSSQLRGLGRGVRFSLPHVQWEHVLPR
jgi:hypothetical protein